MNGDYTYSFLVKGKPGTEVVMIIDKFQNSSWIVQSLAHFIIPDKGLYKIEAIFSVDDLKEKEYFLVGARIYRGEAYVDNFCLKTLN